MRWKQFLWLALLLPQFALLLLFAYEDVRNLRYQLQFHSARPFSFDTAVPFNFGYFVWEMLGIVAVLGLCGRRWWARYAYTIFAAGIFAWALPNLSSRGAGWEGSLWLLVVSVCTLLSTLRARIPFALGTSAVRTLTA